MYCGFIKKCNRSPLPQKACLHEGAGRESTAVLLIAMDSRLRGNDEFPRLFLRAE